MSADRAQIRALAAALDAAAEGEKLVYLAGSIAARDAARRAAPYAVTSGMCFAFRGASPGVRHLGRVIGDASSEIHNQGRVRGTSSGMHHQGHIVGDAPPYG